MLEYGLSANGIFAPEDSNVDTLMVIELKSSHAYVFHSSLLARFTKDPLLRLHTLCADVSFVKAFWQIENLGLLMTDLIESIGALRAPDR